MYSRSAVVDGDPGETLAICIFVYGFAGFEGLVISEDDLPKAS